MTYGILTQDECNPEDPEEFAAWAFNGLLGPGNAVSIFPQAYNRKWSKIFYDLGFRHHPELQTVRYDTTMGNGDFISGSMGEYVKIDEQAEPTTPAATGVPVPDISGLSAEEKRVLYQHLREKIGDAPATDGDTGNHASVEGDDQ